MADSTNVPAVEEKEIATAKTDITFPVYGGIRLNTDDTLATRGSSKGLKLYDEIERDTHVYGVLQKRKLAVTARPWDTIPASDSPLDKKAAEICKLQLAKINFDKLTVDALDAILKGFSIGEVMWVIAGDMIRAKTVIARDQRRFVFDDESKLRMRTMQDLYKGIELPERKFIHHTFGAKDGSPYGLGLGTRLFWPVLFKRKDITFWLTYTDKFGTPTTVGKYPPGTPKPDQDKLLSAISAIATDTGIIVPEGMLIEFLEAARAGNADGFEKLAKYMDDQISEAVLGETMSTNSRSSSLGQGGVANVHNEVRLELVRADADLLSGTLNDTLMTWITEYNVPGANPPQVYRQVEEQQDLTAQATRDRAIFAMGFKPSLKYINNTYGGEWTEKPAPPAGAALGRFGQPAADAANFAETVAFPDQAKLDNLIDTLSPDQLQDEAIKALQPLLDLIKQSSDATEALGKLAEIYPAMDDQALQELLARTIFIADVWGRLNGAAS